MRKLFIYFYITLLAFGFCSSVKSQEWVKTFKYVNNGIKDGEDKAFAMTVDSDGNIIVTGIAHGWKSGTDICTIKYEPNGDTMWVRVFGGIDLSEDKAYAITVDDLDNIYITGHTTGDNNYSDIIVLKYSSSGTLVWFQTYGSRNGDDMGNVIVADNSNNVYVGGFTTGEATGSDYIVLKYNSTGVLQWSNTYTGTGNSTDIVTAIDVNKTGTDSEDYVAVTGCSRTGQTEATEDVVTIAYKRLDGQVLWTKVFNGGTGNVQDKAYAITVDTDNAIYVTGTSKRTATNDIFIIKYDYNGTLKWSKFYDGNYDDVPSSILATSNNNLLVCGYTMNSPQSGSEDFVTLNYHTNNGNIKWQKTLNGRGKNTDAAIDMVVSKNSQSIYVTGYSKAGSSSPRYDILTAKYRIANGDLQDSTTFNTSGYDDNNVNSIAIDKDGNIYISGFSVINTALTRATSVCVNSYMLTMKYSSSLNKHHGKHTDEITSTKFRLGQNFPNPFNPVTIINFSLPEVSYVTLRIYDITGREVFELVNGSLEAGDHTVHFDGSNLSSGVYLYKLKANGVKDIKRMILLK